MLHTNSKFYCIVENTITPLRRARKSDDPVRAFINKNFLIRYRIPGEKGSRLVSAGQYAKLLERYAPTVRKGYEGTKNEHFKRVINSKDQKIQIPDKYTIKITFVAK